jgi:GNAT superfamily N-acetyltransferase
MVDIELARGKRLATVRAFYASIGYGGGVSEADVVLAAMKNDRVTAAVRLCEEHGVTVLRGMFVAPAYQRQGIGRALLARCSPWLDRSPAWCLPYDHLVDFYREAGFLPAPKETLPPFLRERLDGYLASGQRVLAMWRSAGT